MSVLSAAVLAVTAAAAGWNGTAAGLPLASSAVQSPAAPGSQRRLGWPDGVALDRRGDIYVTDSGNAHINKLTPGGRLLAQWGRWGTDPGELWAPGSLAVDADGNVYVVDAGKWTILKFSPAGKVLAEWGGPVYRPVLSSLLFLNHPSEIAFDGRSTLYIADTGDNRIVMISTAGRLLRQWATVGEGPGQFIAPMGVAVDAQGNVYVSDSDNFRIQKLSPSGRPLAEWSLESSMPGGLAVDARGDIYVVDLSYSRILKLSPAGKVVAHWGTYGTGPRQFVGLSHVAADPAGTIYVADSGNERVVKRSATGQVLAIWR